MRIEDLAVLVCQDRYLKTGVSCVDEVQLLVLLVGGIRVVVLADEAIAGIPSGVGVDTERWW